DEPYTKALLWRICAEAGVEAPLQAPTGVEAVRRRTTNDSFLFVLNHNPRPVEVKLEGRAQDLLTGSELEGMLSLEPFGAAVLRGG
ncbi:MAG: Beta-galactosidase C-terminal domain, partial [Rubrobacter sp.]